jgi:glycine cleavage system H lipoate-binding protein
MTSSTQMNAKTIVRMLGIAALALVALPILALMAFGVRFLVPLVLGFGIVAWFVSPAFRGWFMGQAEALTLYHGFRCPPADRLLHARHAWTRMVRGRAEVGLDDLAQRAVGPIDSLDPLAVGATVKQGDRLFSVMRAGRRLDIKAPCSGVVSEVNPAAIARPACINDTPYAWVVRLESTGAAHERAQLQQGPSWFRSEVDRLLTALSPAGAPAMADGGVVVADIAGQIDDDKWQQIQTTIF